MELISKTNNWFYKNVGACIQINWKLLFNVWIFAILSNSGSIMTKSGLKFLSHEGQIKDVPGSKSVPRISMSHHTKFHASLPICMIVIIILI